MSFTIVAVDEVKDAMLVGGLQALLDAGPNQAHAIIYQGSLALVTMVFNDPATYLQDHELWFGQMNPAGDLITAQGDADTFELYNAGGLLIGHGDVSDAAGSGTLKISGTSGTRLYAGASAILDELKISIA